jgi:uncharacterized protein involved in outer membrane biogenesis
VLSRRRLFIGLLALTALLVLAGGLWALPEVVRRVAVRKLPELTGRATTIEDVDLNLFTGRFAVTKLRMARRPGHGPEAFVEFDRLEGRVNLLALLRSEVRLVDLSLSRPAIRITRVEPFAFDFSDLLALLVNPVAPTEPSRWTVTLGRLAVTGGALVVDDGVPSPPQQWTLEEIEIGATALTTRPTQPAGRLRLTARLGDTRLALMSDSVQLSPLVVGLDVRLSGFDVTRLRPYLSPDVPAVPLGGRLHLALHIDRVRTGEALAESSLSGEVRVEGLSMARRDRAEAFLQLGRLSVAIKRMDFLARDVALGAIDVEGFDVKAERSAAGEIDLLALAAPRVEPSAPDGARRVGDANPRAPAVAATPESSRAPPSDVKPARVRLDSLAIRSGTLTLVDAAVQPRREWKIENLRADAASLSTAGEDGPGTLRVGGQLSARPGSRKPATFAVDASAVQLDPGRASARFTLSDFALEVLGPYWPATLPATAPEGLVGLDVNLDVEKTSAGLARAIASGTVRLGRVAAVLRGGSTPFLKLRKLALDLARADVIARRVDLKAIEIDGLDLRAIRDAQGRVDLLSLSAVPETQAIGKSGADAGSEGPVPSAMAAPSPPLLLVTLDRLALRSSNVALTDQVVTPPREWQIGGLRVHAARLSTSPKDAPGRLRLRATVRVGPGESRPASLDVDADSLRLAPLAGSARVTLDGFDLSRVGPYWPPALPTEADEGVAGLGLRVGIAQDDRGLSRAVFSGDLRLNELALRKRDAAAPFLRIPALSIGLRQADFLARTVALDVVDVKGAVIRAVRDAAGKLDLLGLAQARMADGAASSSSALVAETAAAAPAPSAATPNPWRVDLDRFVFSGGSAIFEDRAVSPVTTLTATDVRLGAERVAWPLTRTATFSLGFGTPGGGRVDGKGTAVLDPLNVQVALSLREGPIEPYQAYFPFAARLRGQFSGDSLSEMQRGPKGELILASRGTSWASNLDVRAPGVEDPVVRVAAVAINDIDFSWPNYALVQRVILTRPEVHVERDAQGAVNLRTLFTPRSEGRSRAGSAGAPEAPKEPRAAQALDAAKESRPAEPPSSTNDEPRTVIDFAEITIENGHGRFIDHTTTPPFSEDISRLALTIKDFSNVLGRPERTTLSAQALIGVDGAIDVRGDLAGIGENRRADLVVELRDYSLPITNPYAEMLTSWMVQRGTLQAKLHYRIEGDRVTADNELAFKKLRVGKSAVSDQTQRRIGVPLGLAVALLKDENGDIDFKLPLTGTLSDQNFDWGETVWAGVKQVIAKVLLSPFRAVGRLFKGDGDEMPDPLRIDPVIFAPGSAVIAPSIEPQLTRLADFLRGSPGITLRLASVLTAADVASVKEQQVQARLEALRREQQLADLASAIRADYRQRVVDVPLPKTTADQIALLVSREPLPEAQLGELARRRLDATRNDLVKARAIPEARVTIEPPSALPAAAGSGEGRVEFTLVPAEE